MVQGSGVHHAVPIANAPVVTASSSQYFERTFNRLVAPPLFVEQQRPQQFVPVQPIQPIPVQPVTHLQPVPSFQSVIPIQPVQPLQPAQSLQPAPSQPVEPNVAIAIATANAAAPVATILLPPYPFGFPPSFGFIPREQATDDKTKEETTTQNPTTQTDVKTTREPEATTQEPDASDNTAVQALPSNQDESQVNFRQYLGPLPSNHNFKQYSAPSPLPSNQNVNFRQYLGPNPQPQRPQHHLPLALPEPVPHHHHNHHPHKQFHVHPLKLKTLVEVQRVPLAYIAPPPLPHFGYNHKAIKVVKHVHSFVPSKAKLIIRPVLKTRSIPANTGYKVHRAGYQLPHPLQLRSIALRSQNARPFITKEIEPTTFRPFPIPNTQPPRL